MAMQALHAKPRGAHIKSEYLMHQQIFFRLDVGRHGGALSSLNAALRGETGREEELVRATFRKGQRCVDLQLSCSLLGLLVDTLTPGDCLGVHLCAHLVDQSTRERSTASVWQTPSRRSCSKASASLTQLQSTAMQRCRLRHNLRSASSMTYRHRHVRMPT